MNTLLNTIRATENRNKVTVTLYFISGILFFISALISKEFLFALFGCVFTGLGIKCIKRYYKNGK